METNDYKLVAYMGVVVTAIGLVAYLLDATFAGVGALIIGGASGPRWNRWRVVA